MENSKEISGKILAESIYQQIAEKPLNFTPRIIDCLFGNDEVAMSFVRAKQKKANELNWQFDLVEFPVEASAEEIKTKLIDLQNQYKSDLAGLIIQLPIPAHLDLADLTSVVEIKYDVDCLKVADPHPFKSPIVKAVEEILKFLKINIFEKKIALIGAGFLVGKPLALWLISQGVSFAQADITTADLAAITSDADIIISGVGQAGLLTADIVKEGVVIIDAGTSNKDGVIVGDAGISALEKASHYTPVPGGVGPLTVACMLENVYQAALTSRELTN